MKTKKQYNQNLNVYKTYVFLKNTYSSSFKKLKYYNNLSNFKFFQTIIIC